MQVSWPTWQIGHTAVSRNAANDTGAGNSGTDSRDRNPRGWWSSPRGTRPGQTDEPEPEPEPPGCLLELREARPGRSNS